MHIPRSTAHNLILCPFVPYFGRTPLSDVLIHLVIYDNHAAFQPVIEVFLSENVFNFQKLSCSYFFFIAPHCYFMEIIFSQIFKDIFEQKNIIFCLLLLFVFSKINSSVCSAWCPSFILWIFHKYLVSLG